jgi:hypothetical protein
VAWIVTGRVNLRCSRVNLTPMSPTSTRSRGARDNWCSVLPMQKNWLYTILVVGGIILAAMLAYSFLGWTGMR